MNKTETIQKMMLLNQKECHQQVETLFSDKKKLDIQSYQDATNIWLFKKLAELEYKLKYES